MIDEALDFLEKFSARNNWEIEKKEKFIFAINFALRISELLSDKNSKSKEVLLKSLIVELFDFKGSLKNLRLDTSLNDSIVVLNPINVILKQSDLDLKLLPYIELIDESNLNNVLFAIPSYFEDLKINLEPGMFTDENFECFLLLNKISDHPLINILLDIKLYLLKNHSKYIIATLLETNSKGIEEKKILVLDIISHLKNGLSSNKIIEPIGNLLLINYVFNVSKSTSDKFIVKKIEILNHLLECWNTEKVEISEIYNEEDVRIDTDLSKEEIMNYFMRLNRNYNGKEILTEKQITNFVCANFLRFPIAKVEMLSSDLPVGNLKFFIYDFYSRIDKRNYAKKQEKYCILLINNFVQFSDYKLETLTRKLACIKPVKYYL